MNCGNCGNVLNENDKFCASCGTPVNQVNLSNQGTYGSAPNMGNAIKEGVAPTVRQEQVGQNMYQNYGQPVYQSNYVKPKKSNTGLIVGIIVAVIAVIGITLIGGLIFVSAVINETSNSKKKENTSVVSEENVNQTSTDGGSEETITTYKVTHDDYTYELPSNVTYEDDITSMILMDDKETWLGRIHVGYGTLATLRAQKDYVKSTLVADGCVVNDPVDKTVAGKDSMVFELEENGQKGIIALLDMDESHFVQITCTRVDNEMDYELLEQLVEIATKATPVEQTMNMESGISIDVEKIDKIAKEKKKSKK